jgi:hypothetical protein
VLWISPRRCNEFQRHRQPAEGDELRQVVEEYDLATDQIEL